MIDRLERFDHPMPRRFRPVLIAALCALPLFFASAARADFGIVPGSYSASVTTVQAGAHPDLTTSFEFNNHPEPLVFGNLPDDNARSTVVQLPVGFAGNPQAYPQCEAAALTIHASCPLNTQVGVITYTLGGPAAFFKNITAPIYNMEPQGENVAELGISHNVLVPGVQFHIILSVRASDHGITAAVPQLGGNLKPIAASITIWGVPAEESHDGERGSFRYGGGCLRDSDFPYGPTGAQCPSTAERVPFLSNPTQCNVAKPVDFTADSWQNPGVFLPTLSSDIGPFSGCDQLEFSPAITSKPTTNLADSPTGLEFNLQIPQSEDPDGLATAHLKDASVTLPEGIQLNPSSANGLGSCSPEQIGLLTPVGRPDAEFNGEAVHCPDSSRVGTVEVDTPVLDHPVPGSVYLATQDQNPFASLLAIYIVLEDDKSDLLVKIPARVDLDQKTGRLTTVVEQSPQLPFEDFHLNFFKGAGAPLKTGIACGTFKTTTDLTPWSSPEGADATPSDSFQINAGAGGGACLKDEASAPDTPSFEAGTLDATGGRYSPFTLKLARADGTQQITGIDTTLPPGLIGRLAGTTYCSDAALATAAAKTGKAEQSSPSCPASSKVGSVQVGAGAGPTPYYTPGNVYLAGPYKSAPLSLAVITPAVAGPFDLGGVVVRTALFINQESTQIHAVSDPFPSIIKGIPLDLRAVLINLDRSEFTKNPTSCDPFAITATATMLTGQSAPLSNPFQVGDCQKLKFAPKLALKLKGPTKRTSHPRLIATLTAKPGEANIARAQVKLPKAAFLDNAHIKGICTRPAFATHSCPANSVYGKAKAITPLLDAPLSGNVYLRANPAHKLPDLVADLNGQIEVTLAGKTDSVKGALRNTFEAVPDAPVSSFRLELFGGKRGLIEMSSGFCRSPKASVKFDAQNGKVADSEPVVGSSCKRGDGKQGH